MNQTLTESRKTEVVFNILLHFRSKEKIANFDSTKVHLFQNGYKEEPRTLGQLVRNPPKEKGARTFNPSQELWISIFKLLLKFSNPMTVNIETRYDSHEINRALRIFQSSKHFLIHPLPLPTTSTKQHLVCFSS